MTVTRDYGLLLHGGRIIVVSSTVLAAIIFTRSFMLSQRTISDLRRILKEDYGHEVSEAEASEIAHTLVGYYDLLAKIYHREKTEQNNNNRDKNNNNN